MNIYRKLKEASEGSDEAITYLLEKGTVERFTENDRGMITESFMFADKNGNIYTYDRFSIDKTRFNVNATNATNAISNSTDLGNIVLKSGARFYADTYEEALLALESIKQAYENMVEPLVKREEYNRLQSVKDAIEETENKIEYYRQKQGKGPGKSNFQLGEV